MTPPTPPSTTPGARSPPHGARSTRRRGRPTPPFRVRCLRQLHQALLDNVEELARSSSARSARRCRARADRSSKVPSRSCVGTPTCSTATSSSEDLGERDTFAGRHHRWIEQEAAGVVGAIAAYNYPIQLALAKLAPALAAGCTVVLKGAPDTPWATLALGNLIAEAHRHPAGRGQRPHLVGQRRRRRADDPSPRRRRRVVHRLDAGRARRS